MRQQVRSADSPGKPLTLSEAQPERRSDERHTALLRVGLLHTASSRELCVVKNISPSGLSARAYWRLEKGEQVEIEFKSGEMFGGSVIWESDWDFGIAFARPIDVESVLASRWITEAAKRRNLPRIAIECASRLRTRHNSYEVMLHDISQAGARLEMQEPKVIAGQVTLSLPGLPAVAGVIRWAGGARLGISFNECIAFDRLARWIQAQRCSRAA